MVRLQVLPEPAEHVTGVATVATVVAPGEPVVELGQFVLPCQADLLIGPPRSCQAKVTRLYVPPLKVYPMSPCCRVPGQLETGVPMFMRHSAQRGRGFLQPGQLVTLDLVGEPPTPYWLKPRPW